MFSQTNRMFIGVNVLISPKTQTLVIIPLELKWIEVRHLEMTFFFSREFLPTIRFELASLKMTKFALEIKFAFVIEVALELEFALEAKSSMSFRDSHEN